MNETERPEGEQVPEPNASPVGDAAEPPGSTGPQEEAKPAGPTGPEEEVSPETIAHTGKEFVEGLLASMELEADVSTRLEEERAVIDVTGDDLGVLIGRRGQTLDALQEVTRTAVQRRLRSRVRLLVDVEGYRSRRRESLTEYARSMASRAMERGTEIELEPMNAYERKVVHDAVSEIEGASSYSEGEEPNRKVIIRGD
jgi:spoIIIJ-associated protein